MTGIKKENEEFEDILSDDELEKRLVSKGTSQLIIMPKIGLRIKGGSIDLRTGTKFIITKRARYPVFDPIKKSDPLEILEKITVPFNKSLVLHPGQLILAITLEYICLPCDIAGEIVTRSSFGRIGLITATATYIHPGYKGCPTLELYNCGETPIIIYPAMRITQIILRKHRASVKNLASKYSLATEPEYPKIWDDWDIEILNSIHNKK